MGVVFGANCPEIIVGRRNETQSSHLCLPSFPFLLPSSSSPRIWSSSTLTHHPPLLSTLQNGRLPNNLPSRSRSNTSPNPTSLLLPSSSHSSSTTTLRHVSLFLYTTTTLLTTDTNTSRSSFAVSRRRSRPSRSRRRRSRSSSRSDVLQRVQPDGEEDLQGGWMEGVL